jgi:hypothetical protein
MLPQIRRRGSVVVRHNTACATGKSRARTEVARLFVDRAFAGSKRVYAQAGRLSSIEVMQAHRTCLMDWASRAAIALLQTRWIVQGRRSAEWADPCPAARPCAAPRHHASPGAQSGSARPNGGECIPDRAGDEQGDDGSFLDPVGHQLGRVAGLIDQLAIRIVSLPGKLPSTVFHHQGNDGKGSNGQD